MSLLGKKSLRIAKHYTLGYSETQAKVRNATSNDPWPPSAKELEEITQLSSKPDEFVEIMEIVSKRLGDKGKNWRHVHKSLILSEHLLLHGPETVLTYLQSNMHIIKTLKEFEYVDEKDADQGAQIRAKATSVASILTNPSLLRAKRRAREVMRSPSIKSILSGADEETKNENMARRDHSLTLERAASSASPEISRELYGDSHADLLRAMEDSKGKEVAREVTFTGNYHPTGKLIGKPIVGKARKKRTAEEMQLYRAVQLSMAEHAPGSTEGRSGLTSEDKDMLRAMQLSLQDDQQVRPSLNPLTDNGASTLRTSTIRPPPAKEPDLLVDVSVPESDSSPGLQYATFVPGSSTSYISPLPVSSTLIQDQSSVQLVSAFTASPQTQLSPMQPQMYSTSPSAMSPPALSAYGSNNPFSSRPNSFISQAPSQSSPPPCGPRNTLFPPSAPAQALSATSHLPISRSEPSYVIGSNMAIPLVSSASHPGLEAVYAAHTQGIDTFGNAGELRNGTFGIPNSLGVEKNNNPFATFL